MVVEWPKFEWHRDKAASNLRKHGVRFETAVEVFSDPAVLFEDDPYSEGEYRDCYRRVDGRSAVCRLHRAVWRRREDHFGQTGKTR